MNAWPKYENYLVREEDESTYVLMFVPSLLGMVIFGENKL